MALKNINFFGQATNRTQIRENIISYLKDQFIQVGGYYNVTSGILDYDGNDASLLQPSHIPGASGFQFWSTRSNDLVWETGVQPKYTGGQNPITPISGIYINDAFVPTGTTGANQFYVDYARGGVFFQNSAKASGTKIWMERSERSAFVYQNESNEYRTLIYEHQRYFDNPPGSGQDTIPKHLKAFLPAIFVDIQHASNQPYQLGSTSMFKSYRIDFDIFAEDIRQFDFLRDACISLEAGRINMYDVNKVEESGFFPLNYRGERQENPQTFSGLVNLFPFKLGNFGENVSERRTYTPYPLHATTITHRFEIVD